MNLIDQAFDRLKNEGKTALIPFLTVGDPDVDTTIEIIRQLESAGADILELGVPYSDPLADGPVIQRASERALKRQISIRTCMETAWLGRQVQACLLFCSRIITLYYRWGWMLSLQACRSTVSAVLLFRTFRLRKRRSWEDGQLRWVCI